MSIIDDLFQLKVNADSMVQRLEQLDPVFAEDIQDLLTRARNHQLQTTRQCKTGATPLLNKLISSNTVKSLTAENEALQNLTEIAEKANDQLTDNRNETAFKETIEQINCFVDSYKHFLDMYGFSLLASQENLVLAQDIEGNYVSIPHEKRRTHIFQIGRTGQGKSEMMLGMALQDILGNRGGILADPFGSMARKASTFAMSYETMRTDFFKLRDSIETQIYEIFEQVETGIEQRVADTDEWEKLQLFKSMCEADPDSIFPEINIKLIDLSKKAKFNPYKINIFSPIKGISVQDCVALIMDTIENVMGQKKQETATAKNVLESLFALLTVSNGNINNILEELNSLKQYSGSGSGLHLMKSEALEKLRDSEEPFCNNAADYLSHLLSFKGGSFLEMISSSRNRISLLVNSRLCHSIFNTRETTIDIEEIVNSNEPIPPFIIFNCPFEEEGANIVGQYLLRLIEHVLYNRDEKQKQNTFYMYFDELHRWLGDSTLSAASMADRFTSLRQHGGALTVAMQTASQLKKDDPSGYVFDAIAESCKTKIVFSVGVNDARYFAESIFPNKGNMKKVSHTISEGKGQSYSYNASIGINQTKSEGTNQSTSFSEGVSKTLGNTVSETFSNSLNKSHARATTTGSSAGSSTSHTSGISQRKSEDITEKTSSMLGVSIQRNNSLANTRSEGTSEQKGGSTSQSNSESKTSTTSDTYGISEGISVGTSESIGAAETINANSGYSRTEQPMSIEEETRYLSQSISNLDSRECFITSGANIKKCVTLDSLLIKLEQQIQPYLDKYYQNLFDYQELDREQAMGRIEVSKEPKENGNDTEGNIGIDELF